MIFLFGAKGGLLCWGPLDPRCFYLIALGILIAFSQMCIVECKILERFSHLVSLLGSLLLAQIVFIVR